MAISGYSATLSGSTSGSITGIESVSVGGVELAFAEIKTIGDTNRIGEHIPLGVTEGPIVMEVSAAKAIYDTCRDALIAQTSETWTLTDSESSTHVGTGYISGVTGLNLDTQGHATFTLTLQPATSWAFTAGA